MDMIEKDLQNVEEYYSELQYFFNDQIPEINANGEFSVNQNQWCNFN